MTDELVVSYEQPYVDEGKILWRGGINSSDISSQIFFEFTRPTTGNFSPNIRPFLLAYLLPAMRLNRPLRLTQPISTTTYHNVLEWQSAYASLLPDRLSTVPIHARVLTDSEPKTPSPRRSMTTFSGGVDSCFTVLANISSQEEKVKPRTLLQAGLMVHGFDIPLSQSEIFESAWISSKLMLQSWGLEAYHLRTNLRSLEQQFGCDWAREAHGIWLAASLCCYESFFDEFLIPSSYPHTKIRLPWGSNAVTDPLFSSDTVSVWHDGASYNRLEKIEKIANDPTVRKYLRVCWEGSQLDKNCGRCCKCVATQACFAVAGNPSPSCFESRFSDKYLKDIRRDFRLDSRSSYPHLFREIRRQAELREQDSLVRAIDRMFVNQFFFGLAKRVSAKLRLRGVMRRIKQYLNGRV